MDLDVLFEDEHLIVINKPAGLTVHPAPGNKDGTLVNGLLHHCPDLPGISGKLRPGIVHRLDKDTTGCIVIAMPGGPGAAAGADPETDRVTGVFRGGSRGARR